MTKFIHFKNKKLIKNFKKWLILNFNETKIWQKQIFNFFYFTEIGEIIDTRILLKSTNINF